MTITGPDARSGAPGQGVVDAAMLVLERMGLTPADLLTAPAARPAAPTFAEYVPVVPALVSDGCRKAYGSYWNRVTDQWGSRRIDEPTPSEIRQLVQHVRANVVPRRNSRGGRSAAEHLIAALRCMYKHAEEDGLISPADNPARKVDKPRRLPSTRRAVADKRLAEINHAAATTGDDPELDTLLLRLHTETACRRGGALALRPQDLDPEQCLILLREKGETVRWQPVSPTLMAALLGHAGGTPGASGRAAAALPQRPPHHLPALRPSVGTPRPVSPLGTGAADQHALDTAHDPDMGRAELRLRRRQSLRGPHRQRQRRGRDRDLRPRHHPRGRRRPGRADRGTPPARHAGTVVIAMAALTAGVNRSGTADVGPGGPPAARTSGQAGGDRSAAVSSGARTVRSWPLLVLAPRPRPRCGPAGSASRTRPGSGWSPRCRASCRR